MKDRYIGLVPLGTQISASFQARTTANAPHDADSAPTYRIYGPAGVMANGTGALAVEDSGAVTGATNATPIVVTSNGHKLSVGTEVTISGVLGNTAANGTFAISAADSNTFTLSGSAGNGAYTSGGTWHVAGLYVFTETPGGGDGYAQGVNYSVLITSVVSGSTFADVLTFTVV